MTHDQPPALALLRDAAGWVESQHDALARGLKRPEDVLMLWRYWRGHTGLPEARYDITSPQEVKARRKHMVKALGYDPFIRAEQLDTTDDQPACVEAALPPAVEPVNDDGFDMRWHTAFIPKEHWHFCRQLLLRYRVVLAPGEFTKIVADIADGTAILIKQDSTAAMYSVRLRYARARIFVVARGKHLVTALPPNKGYARMRRQLARPPKNQRSASMITVWGKGYIFAVVAKQFADYDRARGAAPFRTWHEWINGPVLPTNAIEVAEGYQTTEEDARALLEGTRYVLAYYYNEDNVPDDEDELAELGNDIGVLEIAVRQIEEQLPQTVTPPEPKSKKADDLFNDFTQEDRDRIDQQKVSPIPPIREMVTRHYIGIAEPGPNNWGLSFPSFQGVGTVGDTYEELLHHARDALATIVEDMEQNGQPLPPSVEDGDGGKDYDPERYDHPKEVLIPVETTT